MGAIRRGTRNVTRSLPRAGVVSVIMGLAVAVFLTLAAAAQAISAQTGQLGAQVLNRIEVRAAGATGMGIGAEALPESFFAPARQVKDVKTVEPYLYQRTVDEQATNPASVFVGVRPGETLRLSGHGEIGAPTIIDGRNLKPRDAGQNVAVVGVDYARQYGITVGETFTLPPDRVLGQDQATQDAPDEPLRLRAVGTFEAGFAFGNNQVFLPLDVAQDAFAQQGKATHVFVTVASAEAVEQVERDLRQVFGDRADVISGQQTATTFADTLGAIRTNAVTGAGIAAAVAAGIVAFTMALVTRERTREIGVLKALGASRREVSGQILAESLALALLGGAAGVGVFALAGSRLAALLLPRAAEALPAMTFTGGENPLATLGITPALSPPLLAAAVGLAAVLGLAGAAYPLARAVRLSAVEAMRHQQ